MEILKRAKGDAGEKIPWNADPKDVQQEINHRTHKAGYTDRDGQPIFSRRTSYGKGDNTALRTNWGKWYSDKNPLPEKQLNIWPRDENGNLIDD